MRTPKLKILLPLCLLTVAIVAATAGTLHAISGGWASLDFYTHKLLPEQQNDGSLRAGSNVSIAKLTGTGTGTKTSTWTGTATASSVNNTDTATLNVSIDTGAAVLAIDTSGYITTGTSTATASSASVFSGPILHVNTPATSTHTHTVTDVYGNVTTAVDGLMSYADKMKVDGIIYPHGWPTDASGARRVLATYDPATRKVTITANSGGTFDVWVKGVKTTVNSPFVSDAHAATEGAWYFYRTDSAWVWSQTFWDMYSVSPTAYVYWSSLASSGVGFSELHGWNRDIGWHINTHLTDGTKLLSGGVLGGYTLDTDTDAAIQFSISECTVLDEDIRSVNAEKTDGPGFTIWRRSGTSGYWTWSTGNALPFLYGTYPQRNYDAGGGTGWTMADIGAGGTGEYVTAYVVASLPLPLDAADQRFIIIPGQIAYASLALAQGETPTVMGLGTLPFSELTAVAQLVFHARSSYGGTAHAQLASVTRLVGSRGAFTSTAAPTVHNALSGLQGGTTAEYYHLTNAQYAVLGNTVTTTAPGLIATLPNDANQIFNGVGSWVTAGSVSSVASKVALDANDRAVFYFDEAQGTTTFANSGNASGTVATGAGTVYPKSSGLRGSTSLYVPSNATVISATSKWEYTNFTLSWWLKVTSAFAANSYVITKKYSTGAWGAPYLSIRFAFSTSINLAPTIMATASPATYVSCATAPLLQQFPLWEWHHVAMTWDSTYLIFYVDGVEWCRSAAQTGVTIPYNGGEWVIGDVTTLGSSNFHIQDFRINDTARSASYIADMARRGWTKNTTITSP